MLSALFLSPTAAVAQASPGKHCVPLALILTSSGERQLAGKKVICQGEQLPASGNKVSLLCSVTGQVLSLAEIRWRPKRCRASDLTLIPCAPGSRGQCRRNRGAEEAKAPTLLTPYGSTLLNRRPAFSWQPVAGATRYFIQVRSREQGWATWVDNASSLSYPADKPALVAGSSYTVSIYAYQGNALREPSTTQLSILPNKEAQQLQELIAQIKSLNLPKDEEVYLGIDAAYSSRGLMMESVQVLQKRLKEGSRNPAIYTALGDRYLQAGFSAKAKTEYETATTTAEATANQPELNKAEARLKLVAQLQNSP
ncbi:hypothetical protein AVDCRST_MAG94-5730 [uncultured Leptolyngbya sp.]|uniref:Tetratricopeptide repeat protein n=1 Tax=uncultured Leptolyngbya sp. TaxID=332963 RepID=A0A6J4NUA4_9CYAN|nr:hypothetical protein AVDCRST_MAG94-5730 [uncultured Leptolyngbya sp.]